MNIHGDMEAELIMTTKVLKKLKSREKSKPAAISERIRKKIIFVILAWVIPVIASLIMLVGKLWVPGMAWLQ